MPNYIKEEFDKFIKGFISLIFTSFYTVYLQAFVKEFIYDSFDKNTGKFFYGLGNSCIMFLLGMCPFIIWKVLVWFWRTFVKRIQVNMNYKIIENPNNYELDNSDTSKNDIIFLSNEAFDEGFFLEGTMHIIGLQKWKMKLLTYCKASLIVKSEPSMTFNLTDTAYMKNLTNMYQVTQERDKIEISPFDALKDSSRDKKITTSIFCVMGLQSNPYELVLKIEPKWSLLPSFLLRGLVRVDGIFVLEGETR
ncbi:hypothetical protein [Weissella minor]|uniref:Uncharacterized protein n=1 Tax=Weissella minor TaxID=1620 RepID=A0A0R2JSI7_9LACO|nr:hypothetical protein [Weissella minor]KRN77085.1 hypothetical protein IV67_GL000600 [Weissella minor]